MTGRLFLKPFMAAILLAGLAQAAALAGDDWKPVDPADVALKAPVVEPDAEAEVLFWDVRVDDESQNLVSPITSASKSSPSTAKSRRARSTSPSSARPR